MYLPRIRGTSIPLMYFQPKQEIPEKDDFVVEEILEHHRRHGKFQWNVKWKGWDHDSNTWEPAESFLGAIQKDWLLYNQSHGIDTSLPQLLH